MTIILIGVLELQMFHNVITVVHKRIFCSNFLVLDDSLCERL